MSCFVNLAIITFFRFLLQYEDSLRQKDKKVRELELKLETERPPELKALRQLDDHYREKVRELQKIIFDLRSELGTAQKAVSTISFAFADD